MVKSQKGVSLIEVVLSMGIFSIIAVVVGQLTLTQFQTVGYLEDKMETMQLEHTIALNLLERTACDSTLQGKNIPKVDPAQLGAIRNTQGQVLFKSLSTFGRVDIGQITVQNKEMIPANSTGIIDITVPVIRKSKGGGPTTLNPIEVQVLVALNADRKVASCITSSSNMNGGTADCRTNPNGNTGTEYESGDLWYGTLEWKPEYQYSGTPIYKCVNGNWLYVTMVEASNVPQ